MLRKGFIGIMLIASAGMLSGAETPAPEVTVDEFHGAMSEGSSEKVLDHLAPDVIIFEGGGAEMSRDEYAHHHLGGDMKYTAATSREIVDRKTVSAGEAAWVLTRTKTTGQYRDKEVDRVGTETMLLRRTSEGWKIAHIHWSSRAVRKD